MAHAATHTRPAVRGEGGEARLAADILRGLAQRPKRLSPTYLYDARGSVLFERICEQPEYYLTRTELGIMRRHAAAIAERIGPRALLIELGSGASLKTRLLLDRLQELAAYVPVDISRTALEEAARSIRDAYPAIEVLPIAADFTLPFDLPRPGRAPARRAVFFPGSTIGNFDEGPAVELLGHAHDLAAEGGALVIGIDLVKDRGMLLRAYDDAAGVTAAFNLNVLMRLNRELGADFDPHGFRHEAVWNPGPSRIEMHLKSLGRQTIHLAGESIELEPGEAIVTEHCHKYTLEGFTELAARAGWRARDAWLDDHGWFAVLYLERP
jgi:L-histidine Nalpha-methyltransferase